MRKLPTKHIVSVSLGRSDTRNVDVAMPLLGHHVRLERLGMDGNLAKAKATIAALDGKVDAIGLGGIDLYAYIAGRRYTIRDAQALASVAKSTPVVCGAGIKRYLEPKMIAAVAKAYDLVGKHALITSAVDRYAMAEALHKAGAHLTIGDLLFALNLPVGIKRLKDFQRLNRVLLPVLFRLPFAWLYPTGSQQTAHANKASDTAHTVPEHIAAFYKNVDVIAGDWHYICKYLPPTLPGKTIITNTTTATDVARLRDAGVATLITTTPRIDGRSLSTNMLEAALVACVKDTFSFPLPSQAYDMLSINPTALELNA